MSDDETRDRRKNDLEVARQLGSVAAKVDSLHERIDTIMEEHDNRLNGHDERIRSLEVSRSLGRGAMALLTGLGTFAAAAWAGIKGLFH